MISFKDFITPVEKYIAVQYDNATQKRMREWCLSNGFDLTVKHNGEPQAIYKFDFHTTIFYSTSKHRMENGLFHIEPGETKATGFELLGVDKNIPVLKVTSPDILAIRKYFEEVFQMEDAWDSYKPHISLSYAKDNLPDTSNIKLPDFPLTYSMMKVADAVS